MNTEQEDYRILHHTLGITDPDVAEPYRNHFVASKGHNDLPAIERLISAGLMKTAHTPSFLSNESLLFVVTEKGKEIAMQTRPKPEKLSRSKARYRRFLEYGDSFDNFIAFCRWDADPEHSWNQ